MVLLGLGQDVPEARLRELCDCTVFGTHALQAVEAMRDLGFLGTAKVNLNAAELAEEIDRGILPIVFVNALPIDGVNVGHALVVLEMSVTTITVYDPLQGERALPRSTFDAAWTIMRNLTILVKRE